MNITERLSILNFSARVLELPDTLPYLLAFGVGIRPLPEELPQNIIPKLLLVCIVILHTLQIPDECEFTSICKP